MFYDRFVEICAKKNISPSRAAIEAGLSKSTVTKWKSAPDSEPTGGAIRKLSEYFGVAVSELLGEVIEKEKPAANSGGLDRQLDGVEFALFGEVKDLSDAQKRDVLKFVQFLKQKED